MTYLPELYTEEESRAFIRDLLLPYNEVWVAEEGGSVIGLVGLGAHSVRHLSVAARGAEPRHRHGAARAREGATPDGLQLWVFQRNVGARRFYERHGFTLAKLTDGSHNEEQEPDALYAWEPDSPA